MSCSIEHPRSRLPWCPERLRHGLWSLLLVACAGAPLPRDLAAAQALERDSHDEAALAAWHEIRAACPRPDARPHDDCGLAAMREAQLLESLGRFAEAAQAWEALPGRTGDNTKAARGLAKAAEIQLRKLGQPETALALAWRCIERYPDEIGADEALRLLLPLERRSHPAALRQRLDDLARRLVASELGDDLLFFAGEVSAAELRDPAGAIDRFEALAHRFPQSYLRPRALLEIARLVTLRHPSVTGPLTHEERMQACRALERLVKTKPRGSALQQMRMLQQRHGCR